MKKIISTVAMVCLSFSCFAEDYFVKIANNEYVLQHGEKSKDLGFNSSGYGAVAPIDAVYTPTHIFTYPDGNPAHFRNIQKIEYTESKATFVKDMKSKKCCIDILDDKEAKNKCRIIGVNGHNIGSFEVYEAAEEANSFTDSKSRLIFVDHSGLYIVPKEENSIESVSKNYFKNGSFDFKGEIIKISAVDGKREVPGCIFGWPSNAIVSFEESVSYSMAEFLSFIAQIKKITGVMPEKAPPSWDAAKKRMAELLNIPEGILTIEEGTVKLKYDSFFRHVRERYGQLSCFLPFAKRKDRDSSSQDETLSALRDSDKNYKFDTSDEAKKRRKEIALKPWDE